MCPQIFRPGLRERLILCQDNILTENFWHRLALDFSFNWPQDIKNVYRLDSGSSAYQLRFSSEFLDSLLRIENWRMGNEFFTEFPDLQDDITTAGMPTPCWSRSSNRVQPQWRRNSRDQSRDKMCSYHLIEDDMKGSTNPPHDVKGTSLMYHSHIDSSWDSTQSYLISGI